MKLNLNRFIKSCMVGIIGVIPNYILFTLFRYVEFKLLFIIINVGWCLGILGGMTSNYILNELYTWGNQS